MSKQDAIELIRNIQLGKFNKPHADEMPTGLIARSLWNNDKFSYGMEYGAIHGLMLAFDISEGEL